MALWLTEVLPEIFSFATKHNLLTMKSQLVAFTVWKVVHRFHGIAFCSRRLQWLSETEGFPTPALATRQFFMLHRTLYLKL